MSTIEYTAKRTLMAGHIVNTKYTWEVCLRGADPTREAIREVTRSQGGAMEVIFERLDTRWSITFLLKDATQLDQLREMLDSTETGETFRLWLYEADSNAEFLGLKRIDQGHAEAAIVRRGGDGLQDLFSATINALAISDFATTEFSDAVDIYDPGEGESGGGLDPPTGGSVPVTLFWTVESDTDGVDKRGFAGGPFDIPLPPPIYGDCDQAEAGRDIYLQQLNIDVVSGEVEFSVQTQFTMVKQDLSALRIAYPGGPTNIVDIAGANFFAISGQGPGGAYTAWIWVFSGVTPQWGGGINLFVEADVTIPA